MKHITKAAVSVLALAAALTLTGCEETMPSSYDSVKSNSAARDADVYVPTNDVEFNNYVRAQKLYDAPESIIWCTTTWGNASAPLVTVPVAGKLTSSSVSYYPNTQVYKDSSGGNLLIEAQSVDGMYHGKPPAYRYGFTPGGQYVEFFEMGAFCTTQLTEFQRSQTTVQVTLDTETSDLQARAEEALSNGDPELAQSILEELAK